MIKPDTSPARAPRGTKPVSQAFFAALESVPDASRAAVGKAALTMIRDEMKTRKDKLKMAAAKEKAATVKDKAKTKAPAVAAKPAPKRSAKPAAKRAAKAVAKPMAEAAPPAAEPKLNGAAPAPKARKPRKPVDAPVAA